MRHRAHRPFAMSLSNFFARPHYTSDATDFIAQLREQDPGLEERQRQGRGLLWDRYIDPDLQEQFDAGQVPQTNYVYYHWDHADE